MTVEWAASYPQHICASIAGTVCIIPFYIRVLNLKADGSYVAVTNKLFPAPLSGFNQNFYIPNNGNKFKDMDARSLSVHVSDDGELMFSGGTVNYEYNGVYVYGIK